MGADFAPRSARRKWISKSTLRQRLAKISRRAKRLRCLRKAAGPRARLVASAGLAPQGCYGAEVTGFSNGELRSAKRSLAAGSGPQAGGRSLSAVLLLEGDDTWRAAVAPITRWAEEVWRASNGSGGGLCLPELRRIWVGALERAPTKWAQVRGPVGAALLSVQRLGWSWPEPFVLHDPRGTVFKLTEIAPSMLRRLLRHGMREFLERQCAANLHAAGYLGREGCALAQRVSFGPVAKVARSRKEPLEPHDYGCLLSVASGALWTRSRLHDAGYADSWLCPLCNEKPDTEFHRWWECPASAAERLRLTSQETRDRAMLAGQQSLLYSRGVVEHPDEWLPLPAEDVRQRFHMKHSDGTWSDEAFCGSIPTALRSSEYDLYTDGSCSTEPLAERRRASWAVVWADLDGTEIGRLNGVVPRGMPQTPQAAEYLAALAAAEVAQPGHEVYCDCLGVVRHFVQRAGASQLSAKLLYSGVVRLARSEAGWKQVSGMTKVPAHVDLGATLSPDERRKARGNSAADEGAKAAAARHPQPTGHQQTEWQQIRCDDVSTAKLIASVARLWPAARAPGGRLPKARVSDATQRAEAKQAAHAELERVRAANRASHCWVHARGPSRCHFCKVMASNRHAAGERECPRTLPPWIEEVLRDCESGATGHRLLIGLVERLRDPPSAFIMCDRCGGFGEIKKSTILVAQCQGRPTSASAAHSIQRLRNSQFPRPGAASKGVAMTRVLPVRQFGSGRLS